jgi:DNA processing protein
LRPWTSRGRGGETTERIARDGLFLSEFQPGEPPKPHHFPLRNRVISGLCRAVVVIEAAHASGSLITARWAADQGRVRVRAARARRPPDVARRARRLIREGAMLVEDPAQVLADLRGAPVPALGPPSDEIEVSGPHGKLVVALTGETLSSEELARRLARVAARGARRARRMRE